MAMGHTGTGSAAVSEPQSASLDCPLWVQFLDPQSGLPYFYNVLTHERVSCDPDPFGVYRCAVDVMQLQDTADSRAGLQAPAPHELPAWKSRPARVQKKFEKNNAAYHEGQEDFNVWFGKFYNDRFEKKLREPASYQCCPDRDSGWTQADLPGAEHGVFCWFFAQGCCHSGSNCTYHHHVPTKQDSDALDVVHDIFGREKHASHRDDMGGVGSFNSDCLTLFVGDLCFDRSTANPVQTLDEEIRQKFGLWGPVDDVRIIPSKGIAFVRYLYRAAAEFALVAMKSQKLGLSPVITVKWASENPDPRDAKRRRREMLEKVDEAAGQKLASLGLSPVELASLQLSNSPANVQNTTAPYPDTSAQYSARSAASPIAIEQAQVDANADVDTAQENVKRMQSVLARIDAMNTSGNVEVPML